MARWGSSAVGVAVLAGGLAHADARAVELTGDRLVVGMAHEVSIRHLDGDLVVTDSAQLTAGAGCVNVTETTVRCQARAVTAISVTLTELADTLSYRGALPLTVFGGAGHDVLTGGTGPDRLLGGAGDDTLYGGAGGDVLIGDTGEDELHGGTGDDALYGDGTTSLPNCTFDCTDHLHGDDGSDKLHGGERWDIYHGGAGNDTLAEPSTDQYGGNFDGGTGDDVIIGSPMAMRDRLAYDLRTTSVKVDLAAGTGGDTAVGETDLVSSIEDVTGGSAGDKIIGDAGNNILVGGPGIDDIVGGGGVDQCSGETTSC